MSKPKSDRKVDAVEAFAEDTLVRSSPRKLDLVAGLIRGMSAGRAVTALAFSRKRVAIEVQKTLKSAIANAENNHNLDVDRLVVSEAFVGKRFVMKRLHPRARGRAARVEKFLQSSAHRRA